jgi:hypothetical protein
VLAAAIDIRRWLDGDRTTPYAERLARDRAIGRTIAARDDVDRVLAWWNRIRADGGGAAGDDHGARIARLRRVAVAALVALGVMLGVGTAGVAFAYDGRHPVNLFRLLGLLVAVPGLLLAVTIALLPFGRPRAGGHGVLAALDAGRWAGAAIDRLARVELFAPGAGAPLGLAEFARWQVLVFAQCVALGFFAGALGLAVLLVAFTDLAFGWSTTLELAAADVHRLVTGLAAPWAAWLPEAAPGRALTELSRYFRGAAPVAGSEHAARLGGWWPFVLMTICVYGVLPRVLLLVFGSWRLAGAARALLRLDPEVTALLDRLAAPVVATAGASGADEIVPALRELPAAARPEPATDVLLVIWNRAMTEAAARAWIAEHLEVRAAAVCELGATESGANQRNAIARFASAHAGTAAARRVIVLTRGWEPPLLEFGDLLGVVREFVGEEASITVVPVDVTGVRIEPGDRAVWAHTLARLRDPRLYVQDAMT